MPFGLDVERGCGHRAGPGAARATVDHSLCDTASHHAPGNHLCMRTNAELARRLEREAEAFAEELYVDDETREAAGR